MLSISPWNSPTTSTRPRRHPIRLWLVLHRRGARFTRRLSHLARPSPPRTLVSHHIQPREPRCPAEAMSSFSSLSSSRAIPSPASSPRKQPRTDIGLGSRPRVPPTGASTSHASRHRHASSSAGSRARYLHWDQEGLPPSRALSPRNSIGDGVSHAYAPFARTPPSDSKVRSCSAVTLPCNEVSPGFRIGGLGRRTPGIQAHQSAHAPSTTSSLPSPVFAQVAGASLNEPPSLSSSLTSPAPSLAGPPTPQSKHSPVRVRPHSVFVTPSASFSSLRRDPRSCEAEQLRCEPHTPSPSPLSHATRESRLYSHP